jgi:CheY-like chemotaxis protein
LKEGRFPGHLNVAMDGDEAADILWRRGEHQDDPRPDLIVLDLNLPGKNGREILQEIKADPDLCWITRTLSMPIATFASLRTWTNICRWCGRSSGFGRAW